MPQAAEARSWWADVEDVRERIERRRARESGARESGARIESAGSAAGPVRAPAQRGVREVRPGRHLALVHNAALGSDTSCGVQARRRPRPRMVQRIGPRPDMAAAWAVMLGFALVIAAILSAHG